MRIGVPLVDITTGLYAAIGILMALSERQRSGLGQFLETTLYETGLAIMHPHAANYFMHGKPPALTGNEHPNLVPYAIFPTKTDNIFIGVGNDGTFRKLGQGDRQARTRHRSALCPQQGPHRQPRRAARRACRRVQPARGRAALQSPARRRPARGSGAEDRPGADQPAHAASRRCHREGLVQGRRLADPARSQQSRACAARRRNSASTPPRCSASSAIPKARSMPWSPRAWSAGPNGSAEAFQRVPAGKCAAAGTRALRLFYRFPSARASPVPSFRLYGHLHVIRRCYRAKRR